MTPPSCAYQQHVVRGVLSSGEEIAVDACLYFEIENGRITKVEEYFDPGAVTAIVTALQSG
ncbi:nuclear transport factor 2 family protein [Saccharopolyspora sp. 5N708]|uniref:nuclear transport factor 2 family protein n=1 Tax=Saccharopolyspora sp. 5N708 TaxID=3457424 RepID=UPI003FD42020